MIVVTQTSLKIDVYQQNCRYKYLTNNYFYTDTIWAVCWASKKWIPLKTLKCIPLKALLRNLKCVFFDSPWVLSWWCASVVIWCLQSRSWRIGTEGKWSAGMKPLFVYWSLILLWQFSSQWLHFYCLAWKSFFCKKCVSYVVHLKSFCWRTLNTLFYAWVLIEIKQVRL